MKERRTQTRLVGREAEVERLIQYAEAPAVGAVLLTGPMGVGKSRLAEGVMLALTSRGWRGVGLSATASTSRIPLASLSELIPDTLDAILGMTPEKAELAALRAVEEALDLDGTRPVVIAIDDIASFDPSACGLLIHLATNRRLFIVATQALGSEMPEALRRLAPAAVVECNVEPLSVGATAELAAQCLNGPVGPGLVRDLLTRTGGNPLFIQQLLDAAMLDGSVRRHGAEFQLVGEITIAPSLARQIVFRLGLLRDAERDVLELLALAGELGIEDLTAVADAETLEVMEARGLIETKLDRRRLRVTLCHPLHGEALTADITPLVRRRRHQELVAILEQRSARRAEDIVVSSLARVAGGESVDVSVLLDATYAALRLDRIRDAAELAQIAYRTEVTEATRMARAETLIRLGRFIEADDLLSEALPADVTDWERLRVAIRRSSNQLWGFRDAETAMEIDDRCIAELSDTDAIARVVAHQAWVNYCDGRSEVAISQTDHLTDSDHPDVRFAVCAVRAPALVLSGRIHDGADLAKRAWDNGWGADTEYGSHGQHLIAYGYGKLYQGDLSAARFLADAAMRHCRERSENTPLLFFLDLAAWTELLAGELGTALSHFEEAIDLGTDLAIASSVRSSLAGATMCQAQLGLRAETAMTWQRMEDVPIAPGPRGGADVTWAEAWNTVVNGDPGEAAELLRSAALSASAGGLRVLELLLLFDLARLGYAGPADSAAARTAVSIGQGRLMTVVADAIGASVDGRPEGLDASAAALDGFGFQLWAAELSSIAADLWAKSGSQRAAVASQRSADRSRAGLRAAGSPAMARTQTVDPLTKREREVAALAAAGVRNGDIASQLHLSVRTVETHLRNVYRKIGVANREELAEALHPVHR